jgi:hypothetical protein
MLPFLLWLAGCEQERPDVLEKLIFSDDDRWLERDTVEDPFELVGGQCCNDYNPHPLPIDTTIHPVIDPAGDLDYFDIQVTDSYAGRLVLTPEDDDIVFRIFTRTLKTEYEVDTFDDPVGDNDHWTVLYGPSATFTILVAGDKGGYSLGWERVIPTTTLLVERPQADNRWGRSLSHNIHWRVTLSGYGPVTVVLMKGPVVVEVLRRDIADVDELNWTPEEDLEKGADYRILVYLTNDPKVMDISDAFEIY